MLASDQFKPLIAKISRIRDLVRYSCSKNLLIGLREVRLADLILWNGGEGVRSRRRIMILIYNQTLKLVRSRTVSGVYILNREAKVREALV